MDNPVNQNPATPSVDPGNSILSTEPVDTELENQKATARRRIFWTFVVLCIILAILLGFEMVEQILYLMR